MLDVNGDFEAPAVARVAGPAIPDRPVVQGGLRRRLLQNLAGVLIVAGGIGFGLHYWNGGAAAPVIVPPPPHVVVSHPLQQTVTPQTRFLGQFAAVDAVEIRAQVGGTLSEIHFTDGQIVRKGDLLFVIDPRPYQIRLAQAMAQVQTAQAQLALSQKQLSRAQDLRRDDFGTVQNVDQRVAEQQAAQAALNQAAAAVRDAQLDLEYCHVTAPFTGKVSARRVSLGSLISGSRAATSPTTLLTTIMSLDPIYLNFDMSEADYLAYAQAHRLSGGTISDAVGISLNDDGRFATQGRFDFIDNGLDRGSGTIRARATVPNANLSITPGEFARLKLATGTPHPALLVPDAALTLDQSNHVVMTVAPDGTVVPKPVEVGALYNGLRAVQSGLEPTDSVVIDGLIRAQPGAKVTPDQGTIRPATASGQS